jgi:hypothetical protein
MEKEIKDYPEPNESWLTYFRRKRRFSDLILLSWSEIEFNIDQIVAREFGLFYEDKKAQILLEMSFQKKLVFLKENKVITTDEYKIFKKFQEYRNRLFHGKEHPFFLILNDEAKDEIMDNAVKAAQLSLDIGLGIPIQEREPSTLPKDFKKAHTKE